MPLIGNQPVTNPSVQNNQPAAAERESEDGHDQPNDGVRPTARPHQRTGVILTRKRKRDPSSWKSNIRKQQRQSGKRYVNSRGNVTEARSVKTKKDCSKCKFKCSLNISDRDRLNVFNEFWAQNDKEKLHFYGRTTTQVSSKRRGKQSTPKRSISTTYTLPVDGQMIRVCKRFYLTTLDINHKRVETYHTSKHQFTGTPVHLKWGEAANNKVPEEIKNGVREHIRSIPRVESHYCRANTNKEYLPSLYNPSYV